MTLTDVGLALALVLAVIGLAVTAVSLDARRRLGLWPFEAAPSVSAPHHYARRVCGTCGRGPFAITKAGEWRRKHRCLTVPKEVA